MPLFTVIVIAVPLAAVFVAVPANVSGLLPLSVMVRFVATDTVPTARFRLPLPPKAKSPGEAIALLAIL